MNRFVIRILIAAALTLIIAPSLGAASLSGYITDGEDGESLAYATIRLDSTEFGAQANDRGYYAIRNIPAGTYVVAVSYIGYLTATDTVALEDSADVRLDLRLRLQAIQSQDEIIVTGQRLQNEMRTQTGVVSLPARSLSQLPAVGEPDLLRSLQLLPGIQSASDVSSGLYVRGGGPDQTRILLDQIPLYNPSHAFGFFSTFNPDAIKDITLYKGAYPATYGGNLGAVLDVTNREGNRQHFKLSGGVSLISARLLAEGPVGSGSWMASGRRTYLDPILAAIRSADVEVPDYYFYDFNGKFNQNLGANDTFVASTYWGQDDLEFDLDRDLNTFINIRWGNRALTGLWSRVFSPALFGKLMLAGSTYKSTTSLSIFDTPVLVTNSIRDLSLKGDIDYFATSSHTLSTGFLLTHYTFRFGQEFNRDQQLDLQQKPVLLDVYAQDDWQTDATRLRLGTRLSYFSEGKRLAFMPRFSLSRELGPFTRIKFSGGAYRQYLQLVTTEGFSGGDFWVPLDQTVSPGRSWQGVSGVEWEPTDDYQIGIEAYYNQLDNLVVFDTNVAADSDDTRSEDIFKSDGSGYATGIELFLQKRRGRLTGWIGYTLGRTRRTFAELNQGRSFSPKFDRRHDVSFVASYQTGRWRWGTNYLYATGQAFTPASARYTLRSPATGVVEDYVLPAARNSARLLPYHRLDLNAARQVTLFGGEFEFYLQIFNVYSRRNEWFVQYDTDDPATDPEVVKQLPIVPTFGFNFKF
jgi:hypothetical protein